MFRASMVRYQGGSITKLIARPYYHLHWWDHQCMTYSSEMMISPQFRTRISDITLTKQSSECFVQLYSLMMDQWRPEYVGVLSISFQFYTFSFFRSSMTSSCHHCLGLPTGLVTIGLLSNNFPVGLARSILWNCPKPFNSLCLN